MAKRSGKRRGRTNIAQQGRLYWSDRGTKRGKRAGIGYAPRSGSFTRCEKRLRKYLGPRAKGYCAKRFHEATGIWPGSRVNRKR